MGRTYAAICNECGSAFEVSEGSGMAAMPLHCNQCGREWWWEFGPGGPITDEQPTRECLCGGAFTEEAPPRCPSCRSRNLRHDPNQPEVLYD